MIASACVPLFAACASKAPIKRADTYVDRVQVRVQAALDLRRFLLRHNPAEACGCPPFEVKLGETWQRVEIGGDEDDPAIVALLQVTTADGVARDRRVFEVEARLDDAVALCGRGALYVSLVPTAFVGVLDASP